ncbi:AfsR/SARP family transcriptional regulator [Raoultibacter massiliensis]|uniref:AfsR/SARP family transcriptional regulator n=1 Tax=Raoultibacter massiliensis TaxID=1852371 RepID=UPI003A8E959C
MIQNRDVVRFLVAPSGFGKTALALEYAESIFGFRDVFWLNAKSPCFLRDVDNATLGTQLASLTRKRSLVVIEDIPDLTAERAESVSTCIDKLLERGWEVVVTMTPLRGSFVDRQPDGTRICSRDFLVTEEEQRMFAGDAAFGSRDSIPLPLADSVPGLMWGGSRAEADLLCGIVADGLPADVLLGVFTLLVLRRGFLADAKMYAGPVKSDARALLGEEYLFLGVDEHDERFETHAFPIDEVVRAFSRALGRMAASSSFPDADALVMRLADGLLAQGASERACLFVGGCCNAEKRIAWLGSRARRLSALGCLLPAHRLFESRSMRLNSDTAAVFIGEAWRLVGLDRVPEALALAERVLAKASLSDAVRGHAALLLTRYGDADCRRKSADVLKGLVRMAGGKDARRNSEAISVALSDGNRRWEALGAAAVWLAEDGRAAVFLAEACLGCGRTGDVETGILLWALDALSGKGLGSPAQPDGADIERVLAITGDYLRRCEEEGAFGYGEAALLGAWDEAKALASPDALYPPLASVRMVAQKLEVQLFSQRSAFERERRETDCVQEGTMHGGRRGRGIALSGDCGFSGALLRTHEIVPTLRICLFGGLEVRIGDSEVDPSAFRRQKVKTLLALLALNQGKELLRDRLASILWPTSSSATAQRNFYTVWSILRKALSLPGTQECPYLIRLQYSCRLDARTVSSDVAEFDELCGKLLLGAPDAEAWSAAFARLNELYRGDLLPSEGGNEFILRQREEYRARLIDALVSASTRLFDVGELQSALWFAHAAVRKDSTREDAYTALIQAQVASGQRTAALDTYFKCKRYLSDELGIDPSPKAVMLYSSIIEAEPSLKGFVPRL